MVVDNRRQDRMIMDRSFTVYRLGEPCRVTDVSPAGLGITFISDDAWPENIILEYSLPHGTKQRSQLQCRTVWESRIPFYKVVSERTIRRRGLEFVDPESGAVEALLNHLQSMAKENQ